MYLHFEELNLYYFFKIKKLTYIYVARKRFRVENF